MNIAYIAKNVRRLLTVTFFMLLLFGRGIAQDIDVHITLNRSQINSTSLNYLDDLSDDIETYINDFDWTYSPSHPNDIINLDIQITLISSDDNFNFNAKTVIHARSMLSDGTRQSPFFFYKDEDWTFTYRPGQELIHDRLHFNNLTSFLDYYAYLILGYELDNRKELGGIKYLLEAQNIAAKAQSTSSAGWTSKAHNKAGRTKIINKLLNSGYLSFRKARHLYRRGLISFYGSALPARKTIINALKILKKAEHAHSSNLLLDIFFNSKYREITSIFNDAEQETKDSVFNLLSDIDPSHLSEYQKLQ